MGHDNSASIVRALLEAGADPNLESDGRPPICSVLGQELEVMRLLLDAGADINATTKSGDLMGWTVAMLVVTGELGPHSDKPCEILDFLFVNDCDLDAEAADGGTALIHATRILVSDAMEKRLEVIQKLIDLGVEVEARDKEGYTALMYAVYRIEEIRKEIEDHRQRAEAAKGALRNKPPGFKPAFNSELYESYCIAYDQKLREDSLAIMQRAEAILRTAGALRDGLEDLRFRQAIADQNFPQVRRLLANGVDVNFRSPYGYPPINAALNNLEMLDLLLEAGADPNGTRSGEDLETTLHFAIRYHKSLEAVKKLVEAGADINAEGTFGTPLEYAARLDNKEIFNYLKKQGAKNMYAQERGLATDERDLTAVLVHADIDSAAKALAALLPGAEHQPGIQNENVRAADECYLIYQLDGHAWTHLHPAKAKRGESLYGPELAKKLSKKLDTQAIFFENDDTAGYIGYQLFDKGKRTEDVFMGADFAEAAFLWKPGPHTIPDEEEEILRARSARRKLSPRDLEDPDFFDRFLRDADAYLPAWSERDLRIGKTKRYFAKLDPDIFVRVDFVRRAAPKG